MPPKKEVRPDDPTDMPISLRLKYGIHTIFLLVDQLAPFSELTAELFSVLQDRHPDGLREDLYDDPTPIPKDGAEYHIAYGVLKNPHDDTKGWKDLRIRGDETPASKGLRNNDMLAFVIRDKDDAADPPVFVVKLPKLDLDDDEDGDPDELAEGMDEDDDDDED